MKTVNNHPLIALIFFVTLSLFHFATQAHSCNCIGAGAGNSLADFDTTGEGASSNTDSFGLVFNNMKVLPVTYGDVDAGKVGEDIEVKWIIEHQLNMSHYEVEKSTNGASFTKVASQQAANTGLAATYKWLDKNAVKGDNFYRIRNVHFDGSFLYSKIVKVNMTNVKIGMNVYPNPITNSNIGLQMSNLPAGQYSVRLLNMAGQVMISKAITYAGGNSVKQIDFPTEMCKGIYNLEVKDHYNNTTVIKLVY